jgi:competence protein ComEA
MTNWKPWHQAVIFFLCGVSFTAIAFWVTSPPAGKPIRLTPAAPVSIKVQVDGAVLSPGLYTLPSGSRVEDAVNLAGGMSEKARRSAINLAKLIEDGDKITIPSEEDFPESKLSALVDLNQATLTELDQLPGIGESRAQAILEYRESEGLFISVEELLKVPGITESVYAEIQDLVTIR